MIMALSTQGITRLDHVVSESWSSLSSFRVNHVTCLDNLFSLDEMILGGVELSPTRALSTHKCTISWWKRNEKKVYLDTCHLSFISLESNKERQLFTNTTTKFVSSPFRAAKEDLLECEKISQGSSTVKKVTQDSIPTDNHHRAE